MEKKKSIIFYYEWLPLINSLPNKERLFFYDLLFSDRNNLKVDNAHLKSVLDFVVSKVEENEMKYNVKVAKLKENASKGGKASSKSKQMLANATKIKQIERENVNENVNGNGNDIIKKKTIKKENYSEFVKMTNEEYLKLVNEYGETFARKCIEILNNYKGANGKKYRSDYLAIRNWVIERAKKESTQEESSNPFIKAALRMKQDGGEHEQITDDTNIIDI